MKHLWTMAGAMTLLVAGCGHESGKPPASASTESAGARVFIDPSTGKIRKPTADELRALAPPATPIESDQYREYTRPDGATQVKLGPGMMQQLSAEISEDGQTHSRCDKPSNAAGTP